MLEIDYMTIGQMWNMTSSSFCWPKNLRHIVGVNPWNEGISKPGNGSNPGIPLSCGGLWSHSYGMKGFDSSPIQKSYPHYGRFVFDCHHRQTHSPPNISETHLWVANTQVLHILPGKIQYSSWRSLVVCFRDLLFCEISMYFSDSVCLQKLIILLLCL